MEAAALPGHPGLFGNSGIPGRKVVLPRKLWTNLSSSAWIALVCACLVLGQCACLVLRQCPPDSVESLRTSVDHWLLMMETSSFLGSGCLTPTLALCSQEPLLASVFISRRLKSFFFMLQSHSLPRVINYSLMDAVRPRK